MNVRAGKSIRGINPRMCVVHKHIQLWQAPLCPSFDQNIYKTYESINIKLDILVPFWHHSIWLDFAPFALLIKLPTSDGKVFHMFTIFRNTSALEIDLLVLQWDETSAFVCLASFTCCVLPFVPSLHQNSLKADWNVINPINIESSDIRRRNPVFFKPSDACHACDCEVKNSYKFQEN